MITWPYLQPFCGIPLVTPNSYDAWRRSDSQQRAALCAQSHQRQIFLFSQTQTFGTFKPYLVQIEKDDMLQIRKKWTNILILTSRQDPSPTRLRLERQFGPICGSCWSFEELHADIKTLPTKPRWNQCQIRPLGVRIPLYGWLPSHFCTLPQKEAPWHSISAQEKVHRRPWWQRFEESSAFLQGSGLVKGKKVTMVS